MLPRVSAEEKSNYRDVVYPQRAATAAAKAKKAATVAQNELHRHTPTAPPPVAPAYRRERVFAQQVASASSASQPSQSSRPAEPSQRTGDDIEDLMASFEHLFQPNPLLRARFQLLLTQIRHLQPQGAEPQRATIQKKAQDGLQFLKEDIFKDTTKATLLAFLEGSNPEIYSFVLAKMFYIFVRGSKRTTDISKVPFLEPAMRECIEKERKAWQEKYLKERSTNIEKAVTAEAQFIQRASLFFKDFTPIDAASEKMPSDVQLLYLQLKKIANAFLQQCVLIKESGELLRKETV